MRSKKTKTKSFSQFLNIMKNIPVNIKWISLSLFLFMMGWGLGGDTFFSIYVKSLVGGGLGLTLIGTLLALVKLFIVIPVGVMNDQGNTRQLLLLGKIMYMLAGIFYFFAGMESSVVFLVIAVILNGIASSMMFTTYRTVYGKESQAKNRNQVFSVFFSSINMAYVIGALLSAFLVSFIELPYMYLFIIIFALLSILQDRKIQEFLKKNFSQSWKKWGTHRQYTFESEIDEDITNVKKFFGKRGVLRKFYSQLFSVQPWRKMLLRVKSYGAPMHIALAAQGLVNLMNYIGFLFIPIVAIENHLSLSQIAILFAVMRIPYIVNILFGGIGDRYSKKLLIVILVFINSFFYICLGLYDGFSMIIALSFGSALMIALLSPLTSALIMDYTRPQDRGLMSGMQEFVSKIGDISGSLGFGVLAAFIGMKASFVILGLGLMVLSGYLFVKKIIKIRTKDNEAEKQQEALFPHKKMAKLS